MVLDHKGEHASRRSTVVSITSKIGCAAHTRYDRCAHTFMSAICIAATVIFWL
jgi:hypothetical protein